MSIFFNYNGKLCLENTPVITPDNRSFRYGDGLFETMLFSNDRLELKRYHFERLFSGINIFDFKVPSYFTQVYFEEKITELIKINHLETARVRLVIFRGDGEMHHAENKAQFIIQSWAVSDYNLATDNGLSIDVFEDAKKSRDRFSNVKSNNFLPYVMAAVYAKKNKIDDCIVLNTNNRICDTSVANIFIVKGETIFTPPLSEGCIAGVMRRFLIENLDIVEIPLSINDLLTADEIFLTNSIRKVSWVENFKSKKLHSRTARTISKFIQSQQL